MVPPPHGANCSARIPGAVRASGFSLHAGVDIAANQHKGLLAVGQVRT
jgi:hypothetical protein